MRVISRNGELPHTQGQVPNPVRHRGEWSGFGIRHWAFGILVQNKELDVSTELPKA